MTDCRGVWQSEGSIGLPSKQEGQDNYDIIEFLAAQAWSNGKVTMCGNSYLAMTQWFAGAEQPPHLACLAPWEGISDIYRDSVCQGGIANPGFLEGLVHGDIASEVGNQAIDIRAMTEKYPLWNEFWAKHRAEFEKIQCPMYIVSSWTNVLHVSGTFRAWEKCGSTEKWLRVHNSHEWPGMFSDTYSITGQSFSDIER
jgi:predicted acyl esterase